MYSVFLYFHILGAILSIGPFFVLIPLLAKMRTADSERLDTYIDMFRYAIRLCKHSGHMLVVAGIVLWIIRGWPWNTSWILATVFILVSSLFFIARAFSPILRQMKQPGHDRGDLLRRLTRALWIYIGLMLVMMWFMVAKPDLW